MPNTTKGFRYPAATDRVADGALAMQHLAEDVDAYLAPAAWTALGGAAAAGWNVTLQRYKVLGPLVVVSFRATRTGATLTVGANGNLADTAILTGIAAAARPTTEPLYFTGTYGGGNGTMGFRLTTTGQIDVIEGPPTRDIVTTTGSVESTFYVPAGH